MTKRLSVTIALIAVPIAAALVGGYATQMGPMLLNGIKGVAPVGVMIMFAILYFGLMLEVGMFDPLVKKLLRIVGGDPLKAVIGTAVLTMCVALDGDGATTFMITISTMLPLYDRLGMSRLVLAGTICLAAGVMNILPWGGPTARAMTTLHASSLDIFNPVIPAMVVGLLWVFFVAYIFGKRERARLGVINVNVEEERRLTPEEAALRRPKLLWFNVIVTVALVIALLEAV
ncbi:MAG TPA: citrate:proton symporter, partial [Negativicutes bacterium]|nr:citrate:proton symporter [Negativicutes bacterium]